MPLPDAPHPTLFHWTIFGAACSGIAPTVLHSTSHVWGSASAVASWCEWLAEANPGYRFTALPLASTDPRLSNDDWLAEVGDLTRRGATAWAGWEPGPESLH